MLYKYNQFGVGRHFRVCSQGSAEQTHDVIPVEKYCSARIMLGKTAEITHDFEVVES